MRYSPDMEDDRSRAEEGDVEVRASRSPDIERPPDPQLVAEGWERRFMTSAGRLAEYTELYTALGCEVRAEPIRPVEVDQECRDCVLVLHRQIVTLYTRKRSNGASGSD